MRGAWAAGVLAFLFERGQRQYDRVYAASSGACSAAYFVAGMCQPGLTIWREHACKVIRKSNFLRHKPVIDLAYLVDHIFRRHVPLSVEALQKAPTHFLIVLTDCDTGKPVYFHARDERVFAALRATASMPFATRGFDYVDGHPFADGGVVDPIPIRRAIEDGATDITVVLTHSPDLRMHAMPLPQVPRRDIAEIIPRHTSIMPRRTPLCELVNVRQRVLESRSGNTRSLSRTWSETGAVLRSPV